MLPGRKGVRLTDTKAGKEHTMPFKIVWITYNREWSIVGYHETEAAALAHAARIGGHADSGWQ